MIEVKTIRAQDLERLRPMQADLLREGWESASPPYFVERDGGFWCQQFSRDRHFRRTHLQAG